jgi:hypothetical protein|tara:strand:+ start:140 stop:292 length:153 start_codon:yes stop_codon:yes gene_type:complete
MNTTIILQQITTQNEKFFQDTLTDRKVTIAKVALKKIPLNSSVLFGLERE